jgi:ribonuclease HI
MSRKKSEIEIKTIRNKFLNTINKKNPKYIVYTDGAIRKKLKKGGVGVVVQRRSDRKIIYMSSIPIYNSTSSRSEMMAIFYAIAWCGSNNIRDYILFSDSEFCVRSIKEWIWTWIKNDDLDNKANSDIWKKILHVMKQYNFKKHVIYHVHGHVGIEGNELADLMATSAVKRSKRREWEFRPF